MKKIKIFLVTLIFSIIILISNNVQAKDYSIEEIDMKVTILEDGSLKVDQTLEYNFSGSYNGIYITIPEGLEDTKYNSIRRKTAIVSDSLYNASNVIINKISVKNKEFIEKNYANNGENGVYTITNENNLKKIKIFSPTSYASKIFNISYTLNNVAVKHNDIGEVYYNFIGGAWDKDIKKLNIDIKLKA